MALSFIKSNKASLLYLLFIFILPFLFTAALLPYLVANETLLKELSFPQWGLIFILAATGMALSLTHTTFIALASGYFLGWIAVLYIVPAYMIASLAGYYIGKWIDNNRIMAYIQSLPKAAMIEKELKKNELQLIVLSRLSPILPFAVMNLLLSVFQASLLKYLWGGFIGMLPRTLIFIATGIQARNIIEAVRNPQKLTISEFATVFFLVISLAGLFYYIRRAVKRTMTPN